MQNIKTILILALNVVGANGTLAAELVLRGKIESQPYSLVGAHSEDGTSLPVVISGSRGTGSQLLSFEPSGSVSRPRSLDFPGRASVFGTAWVVLENGFAVSGVTEGGKPAVFLFDSKGKYKSTGVVGSHAAPVPAQCAGQIIYFGESDGKVEARILNGMSNTFSPSTTVDVLGTPLGASCEGRYIYLTSRDTSGARLLTSMNMDFHVINSKPINFKSGQVQSIAGTATVVVSDSKETAIEGFDKDLRTLWRTPLSEGIRPMVGVRLVASADQLAAVGFQLGKISVVVLDSKGRRIREIVGRGIDVPVFDNPMSLSLQKGRLQIVGDAASDSKAMSYTIYHLSADIR